MLVAVSLHDALLAELPFIGDEVVLDGPHREAGRDLGRPA